MNLHYTYEERRMLKDKYFIGYKEVAYVIYIESKCSGIKWIVLGNREWGDNITVFYKLKSERMYNRFLNFRGFKTMGDAIKAMKEYDKANGFQSEPSETQEGRSFLGFFKGIRQLAGNLTSVG